MFDFEYFDPALGAVTVSVAEYGVTFSKAAVEVLGRPDFVMLAFDKEKQVIGVIPVGEDEPKKIEFISKLKNGYVRLNTKDFVRFLMKYFADSPRMFGSRAVRYFSYRDDESGVLVVDLKRPLDQQPEEQGDDDDQLPESQGDDQRAEIKRKSGIFTTQDLDRRG